MSSRKSIKMPIIITGITIIVLVFLFTNIKQTVVVCNKTTSYNSKVYLDETFTSQIDGKRITHLQVKKTIYFDSSYNYIEESLVEYKDMFKEYTDYLGTNSTVISDNKKLVNNIELKNNQLVLLDNVSFYEDASYIHVKINPNTKSNNVIKLAVGDNYTDGELMHFFKSKGYSCK